MEQFVRDIVTGSVSGAIYALIAAGLVLTYASTGIFNLGYAGISFSAAFLFFELNTGLGWPQWAGRRSRDPRVLPAAGAAPRCRRSSGGLPGRPKRRRSSRRSECCWRYRRSARSSSDAESRSSTGRSQPAPTCNSSPGLGPQPRKVYSLFSGVVITSDQIIVLVTAVLCAWPALAVFLRSTQTGLRMRAVADRHDLASMRGINDARTSQYAWVLGTVLAGIAGVVGSPILRALDPNTYALAVFVAIAAAVVGGFRSVAARIRRGDVRCGGEQPHLQLRDVRERHPRLQQHRAVPAPDRWPAPHGQDAWPRRRLDLRRAATSRLPAGPSSLAAGPSERDRLRAAPLRRLLAARQLLARASRHGAHLQLDLPVVHDRHRRSVGWSASRRPRSSRVPASLRAR